MAEKNLIAAYLVTKYKSVGEGMASSKQALDGSYVVSQLSAADIEEVHEYKLWWVPHTQVEALRTIYRNLTGTITLSIGHGDTVTGRPFPGGCEFVPFIEDDMISHAQISGTKLDKYNGTIKVIVSRSSV